MNRIYIGFFTAILLIAMAMGMTAVEGEQNELQISPKNPNAAKRIGSDAFYGQDPEELRQYMVSPPKAEPQAPQGRASQGGATGSTAGSTAGASSTTSGLNPAAGTEGTSGNASSGVSSGQSGQGGQSPSGQNSEAQPSSNSSSGYIRGY